MTKIKVYINDVESGNRKIVEATVIRENPASFIVELADGTHIKRKKKRDVVKEVRNEQAQGDKTSGGGSAPEGEGQAGQGSV